MKGARFLLFLVGSFFFGRYAAQDPFHRSYAMADGLASDQVYCANQDHEGFLWFGTDAGVSRFDGLEFVNFGPGDGLSDSEVIGIQEDSQHRIWFLTLNGRLSYWHEGRMHNSATDPELGKYIATSGWCNMCEDDHGMLWFSGIRGELLRLDPKGDRDRLFSAPVAVRNVVKDTEGRVVVITSGSVSVARGETLESAPNMLEGWFPNHVATPPTDMDPLALTRNGIISVTGEGGRSLRVPVVIKAEEHRAVERDASGSLWLYRKDRGVEFIAPNDTGFALPELQFKRQKVNTVFVSAQGDRWYCTATKGVLLVEGGQVGRTEWHANDQSSRSAYISLAQGSGRIWVGTDLGAVLSYGDGHVETQFEPGEGRLPGRILRIAAGQNGETWFASDWGLFHWAPEESSRLDMIPAYLPSSAGPDLESAPSKCVVLTRNGVVYAPGNGLLKVVDGPIGRVRELCMPGSVPRTRIYSITEDQQGVIWFETGQRIYAMEADSIRAWPIPENYAGSRITDILAWSPDTLALATAGQGVLLWSAGNMIGPLPAGKDDHGSMVRRIRLSGDTLLCATSEGVVVHVRSASGIIDTWRWSMAHGLPTNDVRDMLIADGRMVMSTALGLCVAPVRPVSQERALGQLHVVRLLVNDSVHDPLATAVGMDLGDRLVVEVHAVEFAQANEVEYAYAVDGGAWFACKEGRVVLDRIGEGTHVVGVRARSGAGEWSIPETVTVAVRPPWWATLVFRSAMVIGAFSILLFLLYYWSRRDLRRQLERVRALAAVNEERRRIAADVHDDLGADLSRVLMHARQLESAGIGTEARVSKGIVETIDKIDEIIWSLDPKRDTLQSTVHFIEQQARELAEAHGLKFRTDVDLPETDLPLAANERRELLLIAREAMRNVVEHAAANTLRMGWTMANGEIRMAVEDDGIGMPADQDSNSRNGLKNMRDRSERLGGTLLITPLPTGGTRVETRIPVPRNHPIG